MKTRRQTFLALLVFFLIFSMACNLLSMVNTEGQSSSSDEETELSALEIRLTEDAEEAEEEEAEEAARPSETPEPSRTPLPTFTPAPSNTPMPVFTPTLANPGLISEKDYYTEFESDAGWYDYYISPAARPEYELTYEGDSMRIFVESADTYVYNIQDDLWYYENEPVYVEVEISTVEGVYDNNLGVVCRVTDKGWYEFLIRTNGFWDFWRYSEQDGYTYLGNGGSWSINMKHKTNVVGLLCDGDEFTLYINGTETKTIYDDKFTEGQTGFYVGTLEYGGVDFVVHSFGSINDFSLFGSD